MATSQAHHHHVVVNNTDISKWFARTTSHTLSVCRLFISRGIKELLSEVPEAIEGKHSPTQFSYKVQSGQNLAEDIYISC